VDKASEKKVNDSISGLKSTAAKLLGAIGVGFSVAAFVKTADEMSTIRARIDRMNDGLQTTDELQEKIFQSAQKTRGSFTETASTVAQLGSLAGDAFSSSEETVKFAELLNMQFTRSATAAGNVSNVMRQISQGLASGTLRGDEFVSVIENAPTIVQDIAKYLKVSTGDVRKLAAEGKITASVFKEAMFANAEQITAEFEAMPLTFSQSLMVARNGLTKFIGELNDTFGITQNLSKLVVRISTKVMDFLRKATTWLGRLQKAVGGANNMFKLLAVSAGAIFAAMNAGKILKFLGSLKSLLSVANLKILGIAAVIALLFLAVDDFINFLKGNDSVIGSIFDKMGIDAQGVRESFKDLFEAAKDLIPVVLDIAKGVGGQLLEAFKQILPALIELGKEILPPVIDFIKQILPLVGDIAKGVGGALFDAIKSLLPTLIDVAKILGGIFAKNLQTMAKVLKALLPPAMQIIKNILPVITSLIEALLPVIAKIANSILPTMRNAIETLLPVVMKLVNFALNLIQPILDALIPVISFVADLFSNVLGSALESIGDIIGGVTRVFGGLIDFITGVFTGDWKKAWEGIKNIFGGIVETLGAIFKAPINHIITIINGVIGGLNKLKIPDWVPGIGGKGINIPLIPKLAKGSDFSPDTFIAGERGPELITGARGRKVFTASETGGILASVAKAAKAMSESASSLAQDMTALAKGATASAATAQAAVTNNYTVNQTNNFTNTFNGDRAGQQKSSEAMNMASSDITAGLARSLAYAR
jgi:tape measure domain-containing protein